MRIDRLKRDFRIRLLWRAFPLHPETPPEGRTLEALFAGRSVDIPAMLARLRQVATELNLPWGERTMTFNSRLAQELGKWAEDRGRGEAFHGVRIRSRAGSAAIKERVEGSMGNVKVFVLLAGMIALFGYIGGALGGQSGMFIALAIAAVMSFIAYFNSDKVALKAYRAKIVRPEQAPELHEMVDRLRQKAGLPMPTLAVAPHRQPNAFATGRDADHAVVCVTEGLMQLVDRDELLTAQMPESPHRVWDRPALIYHARVLGIRD